MKVPCFWIENLRKNAWRGGVNDKKRRFGLNSERLPNKKDWEDGPGMLSRADLTKNFCINLKNARENA